MNDFATTYPPSNARIRYVRFYGQNLDKWRTQAPREARYDYQYSEKQLREWAPRIIVVTRQTERTYVYFYNVAKGRAVANANQFKRILSTTVR